MARSAAAVGDCRAGDGAFLSVDLSCEWWVAGRREWKLGLGEAEAYKRYLREEKNKKQQKKV